MDHFSGFNEASGDDILDGFPQSDQAEGTVFTTMDDFSSTSFFDVDALNWTPFDFTQQMEVHSPVDHPAPGGTFQSASEAFSLVDDSTTSTGVHAWDGFHPPAASGPMSLDPSAIAPQDSGGYCPPSDRLFPFSMAQGNGSTQDNGSQPKPSYTTWSLSTGQDLDVADLAQDEGKITFWRCPQLFPWACGKIFKRFDSFERHHMRHVHVDGRHGKFPCPLCLKYQGGRAFARKDHLNQHLRKTHNYTPFQCPVDGCEHVGAKGWYREYQRKAHQMDVHGELRGKELATMNAEMDAKVAQTMPSGKKK